MDIGNVLVRRGALTREQLQAALPLVNGTRLDRALIEKGVVSEEAALRALAAEFGMRFVEVKKEQIDRELGPLPFVLVVNKHDLAETWRLDASRLETWRPRSLAVLHSSAKTGEGVDAAFERLAEAVVA